jgi:predicted DNA-binding transcriptional regulator AlpA
MAPQPLNQPSPPRRFLTGPEVCQRYGISNMSLWRWLSDSEIAFPQPALRVRERRYWDEATLVEWERSHIPHGNNILPAKKRRRTKTGTRMHEAGSAYDGPRPNLGPGPGDGRPGAKNTERSS